MEHMFYFSAEDKRLRFDDNRTIKTGITHKVSCKPILCEQGLHASKRIIDALRYAPGHYLWIVELGGTVIHDNNKSCATERTYIAGANIEKILRHFARRQALINIEKIKPYCTDGDYELIVRYLETGDEDVRSAAESAARSAESAASARSAAWSAAWSTEFAAWSAESAAWSVESAASARSAAESAARSAESAESAASARSAANEMLIEMLPERLRVKLLNLSRLRR